MKKPSRQEITAVFDRARTIGAAAFAAGKKRVPALDSELRAVLARERYEIGDKRCNARWDGWIRGWDETNLAAPIE